MATIVISDFMDQKIVSGLNSYQYTIPTAGLYNCNIKVDHRESSAVTVSVVQAGSVNSTLATFTLVPSSTSGGAAPAAILNVCANCAVNDTITFVLTSSAPIDQQLNTIKSKITVRAGGLN